MRFDPDKFKNMVHYVIWKCPDGSKLGSTKLNKILWLSDMKFYMLHGRPISGATYTKQRFGPVPKPIMPVREELEKEGAIKVWRDARFAGDRGKDVFVSRRPPDMSLFSRDELATIDYWLKHVCEEHTAASISEETHDYVWEIAKLGETIPMYAVFAARLREPNAEELAWASQDDGAKPG